MWLVTRVNSNELQSLSAERKEYKMDINSKKRYIQNYSFTFLKSFKVWLGEYTLENLRQIKDGKQKIDLIKNKNIKQ